MVTFSKVSVNSFRTGEEIKLTTACQAVLRKFATSIQSQERGNICLSRVYRVCDKEGKNGVVFCSLRVRQVEMGITRDQRSSCPKYRIQILLFWRGDYRSLFCTCMSSFLI